MHPVNCPKGLLTPITWLALAACLGGCGGGGGGSGSGDSGDSDTGVSEPSITASDRDSGDPSIDIDIDVEDPGDDATTYRWALVKGPVDAVHIADATVEDPTVTFPMIGRYVLEVTVTGEGGSTTERVTVDVDVADRFSVAGEVVDGGSASGEVPVTLRWEPVGGTVLKPARSKTRSDGAFEFNDLIGSLGDFSVKVHGSD